MSSNIAGAILAAVGVVAAVLTLLSKELDNSLKLKYGIVATLLGLALYGIAGSLSTPTISSAQLIPSALFPVDATKNEWQPTGISVKRGDTVQIRVVGGGWTIERERLISEARKMLPTDIISDTTAEVWEYSWSETGGEGYVNVDCPSDCPIDRYFAGALVGMVGNTRYGIGNGCILRPSEDGRLLLRMNDTFSWDNGGMIAVEVTVNGGESLSMGDCLVFSPE